MSINILTCSMCCLLSKRILKQYLATTFEKKNKPTSLKP